MKRLTIISLVVIFGCLAVPAMAGTNPGLGYMPVRYRDTENGTTHYIDRYFQNSWYDVDNDGWCTANHRTAQGRKYDHLHFSNGFPFDDTTRTPAVSVTATKANYAYDADHPGWTRSGSATCEYNCHGYAMDQSSAPVIMSTANGVERFRPDAGYTAINEPTANCINSTTSHSFKITAIYDCNPDRVKTRVEKDDASAIYTITYTSPGQAGVNLYSK